MSTGPAFREPDIFDDDLARLLSPQPDANGEFSTPAEGAKFMASFGIPQIPLRGKAPFFDQWQEKGSIDFAQINLWYAQYKCNFGSIAKAEIGGIWILEIDSAEVRDRYKSDTGREFTSKFKVRSSSDARGHRYFLQSSDSITLGNISQAFVRHEDFSVRIHNEQCVSPGSISPKTGEQYRYKGMGAPEPATKEEIDWLRSQKIEKKKIAIDDAGPITENRNVTLTSIAGTFRAKGLIADEILTVLTRINEERCQPPLPQHEVDSISHSVGNYPAGDPVPTVLFPKASVAGEPPISVSGLASGVKMKAVRWIWPSRIAVKLNLIVGNPDVAKSLIALDIVARVTSGKPWFDGPNTNPISEALVMAAEDDWDDTIAPRLSAAGADMSKVHWLKMTANGNGAKLERELQLDKDMGVLESFLTQHPSIRVAVIDPVSNYLGNTKMVDEQSVRTILTPLKELANKLGVAIICVMHLNKKVDLDAIHRVGGAMAFVGVARMVWLCAPKPEDEDVVTLGNDTMLMVKIKGNIVQRKLKGLSYETRAKVIQIEGKDEWIPYVEWKGEVDQMANELTSGKEKKRSLGGRPAEQLPTAIAWVKGYLSNGAVEISDLESAGKALFGFSPKTLQRARNEAAVKSFISDKGTTKDGKTYNIYSCRLTSQDPAPQDMIDLTVPDASAAS